MMKRTEAKGRLSMLEVVGSFIVTNSLHTVNVGYIISLGLALASEIGRGQIFSRLVSSHSVLSKFVTLVGYILQASSAPLSSTPTLSIPSKVCVFVLSLALWTSVPVADVYATPRESKASHAQQTPSTSSHR